MGSEFTLRTSSGRVHIAGRIGQADPSPRVELAVNGTYVMLLTPRSDAPTMYMLAWGNQFLLRVDETGVKPAYPTEPGTDIAWNQVGATPAEIIAFFHATCVLDTNGAYQDRGSVPLPKSTCNAGGAYRDGNGVESPKRITEVPPSYTQAARTHHIQGVVLLEAIVGQDGAVSCVEVTQSLDTVHGLDAAAVAAVRQWTFAPGTRYGYSVPVLVTIRVTFSLDDAKIVWKVLPPTPRK